MESRKGRELGQRTSNERGWALKPGPDHESLISHGKMFGFYVGCYGEVVLGKEMTCSDQHLRKI